MKSTPEFGNPEFAPLWRPAASAWVPIIFGLLAAIAVTQGSWAALAVLAAIPIILMVPVEFAFGVLAFAVPFDTVTALGGSTFSLSFLVSAGAGAILLVRMLAGTGLATPPRAAKWFFLFFAWSAVSTLWALHPELSNLRLPAAVSLIALYLVAVNMKISDRQLARIGALVILGGSIAASVSLLQFFHGINVAGRASIVFGQAATNSNELAASLILPFSLSVGAVLSLRGLKRLIAVIASLLMLACTFLTMSRGALAALAVMAAVYFYRRGADKRLLALLACGAVLVVFSPDLLRTRLAESVSSRAQGRWDIWLVGLEVVKHHGLFGVGLDNFPVAFQEYAGRQQVFRTFSVVPHNIYLQALAETGILGLCLLLGALRIQLKEIARTVRALPNSSRTFIISYEAAAWALLTHATLSNLLWRKVFWFSWILAAVAVQVARLSLPQNTMKNPPGILQKKAGRSPARLERVPSTPY